MKIFLDDIRTPYSNEWTIVRDYNEFVKLINDINIDDVDVISLDHDLADEHYRPSMYDIDGHYSNYYTDGTFKEKTGYECAKYLIDFCVKNNKELPQVYVHTMNPIGRVNIISLINNFYKFKKIDKSCKPIKIEFYT